MQPFRAKSTVSTYGNVENKERKKDEQFGGLANIQFSTSAMLFSDFDTLVSCRTPEYEGKAPTKDYTL